MVAYLVLALSVQAVAMCMSASLDRRLGGTRSEGIYHLHAALMNEAFVIWMGMVGPVRNRQAAEQTKLLADITGDLVEQLHDG